jgi:hypothetical protein
LKTIVASIIAIFVLIAFTVVVAYMLRLATNAQEPEWTRAVFIFTGVEAIAFAAAGFFFGTEIQRKRAETAEEVAVKGKALAASIKAKRAPGRAAILGGNIPAATAQEDIEELVNLANQLFP